MISAEGAARPLAGAGTIFVVFGAFLVAGLLPGMETAGWGFVATGGLCLGGALTAFLM